jgi:uncharacterized RDD family membrane protein YckC
MKRYNLQAVAELEHGGLWVRTLATLVDCAILFIPIAALEVLLDARSSRVLEGALIYGVWAAYCIPFWSGPWHGTPGKRLCGLTILSSDGVELSQGKAALRYVALMISGAVVVGPLLVAFTERRQGLHDLIAGTVVVKRFALADAAI